MEPLADESLQTAARMKGDQKRSSVISRGEVTAAAAASGSGSTNNLDGHHFAMMDPSAGGGKNKKNLRHAASHPTASSQDPNAPVNKRRSDWRNSHKNYRSTPTSASAASRDAAAAHSVAFYEARRALRDQPLLDNNGGGRRIPPNKRGGSMKEPIPAHQRLNNSNNPRLQPANKRWRCYSTVDYDPSFTPAPGGQAFGHYKAVTTMSKDLFMMETNALSGHRHSFPIMGGADPAGIRNELIPARHQHYRQGYLNKNIVERKRQFLSFS